MDNRVDTLPSTIKGEEEIALVTCVKGSSQRHIRVQYPNSTLGHTNDVLRGTLTCKRKKERRPPCDGVTVFEFVNDGLTFVPGHLFEGDLHKDIAPNAREMMEEAVLCFYGASNRGVVAFCRSAAEEALSAKKVPGGSLDEKIKKAGKYLSEDEKHSRMAHASSADRSSTTWLRCPLRSHSVP